MSNIIHKVKETFNSGPDNNKEQSFTIQPHPAKSNNPADLQGHQGGQGLNSNPQFAAFNTPGPYIPTNNVAQNVEPPASREELRARTAELNE